MTIEKLFPSGAIQIRQIVSGYVVRQTYYGYTRREAIAEFRAHVAQVKSSVIAEKRA